MTAALILIHRWLGIACCLLFAMWFASGIVMHFVPYPALTDAERIAGLAPIDTARVAHGPAEALATARMGDALHIRLVQRSDGPVYLISAGPATTARRATDLREARITNPQLASAIAVAHAQQHGLDVSRASPAQPVWRDQWTVAGTFDRHRILYEVALEDGLGTELYVSSTTGEVVQQTTRRERAWNYVGSVAHWIYPTILRGQPALWSSLVWTVSLLALAAAIAGAVLGSIRLRLAGSRPVSPYAGLKAWHHGLGLAAMTFVVSFVFSGWLSMDSGLLFSTGRPSADEASALAGEPSWTALSGELKQLDPAAREIEWFAFGGRIYRRERLPDNSQILSASGEPTGSALRQSLSGGEIGKAISRIASACDTPATVAGNDRYPEQSAVTGLPVYRVRCGSTWFDVDSANGAIIEKLDPSRRTYRWLYRALHTLDFPGLAEAPIARTIIVVALCCFGLVFSLTGIVLAWNRLASR